MDARTYRPVIDWLKALGITLIILGHLAGGYTNQLTPPVYPKQLGVAFFLFALGYSLSAEKRPSREVVVNRLFEVFLWGLATALTVSVWSYFTRGTIASSNYLPFLLGANVLLNHFPANPTTWYIGTYIHILLFWCIARRVRVSAPILAGVLVLEITCRWLVAENAGLFIAYMTLPNWMTILAAGYWAGQQNWSPRPPAVLVVAGLCAFGLVGYYVTWAVIAEQSFPFMLVAGSSPHLALLATSCMVSALYLGWTIMTCQLCWQVRAPAPIRFLARNTVIVFIVHMPLFYWLDPVLQTSGLDYPTRSFVEIIICLPGLALASEVLHRVLPVTRWRNAARDLVLGIGRPPHAVWR